MGWHYGWDGEPITFEVWAQAFSLPRHVGHTQVGGVTVSTVWLGIDHAYGGGPPLIFETMVFGGDHDEDVWRYATEDEARLGHASVVAMLEREGLRPTTELPYPEGR